MNDTEKFNNLKKLCIRQINALQEGGFSAGADFIDGEMPKYYMHEDAPDLFMVSLDYPAYKFLKETDNLDTGVCPMCGFAPITNEFKFIAHNDHRLQTSICYQCHSGKQINLKNIANVSKCYIATVCYETIDCDEVLVFRNYRDSVLMKSYIGRLFVKLYVHISPLFIDYLAENVEVKTYLRNSVLDPIYKRLIKRK